MLCLMMLSNRILIPSRPTEQNWDTVKEDCLKHLSVVMISQRSLLTWLFLVTHMNASHPNYPGIVKSLT